MPKRLAIVTQDPANYGGVLRLVEYIYNRAKAVGMEPAVLHYARFAEHPELSASLFSVLRGELNLWPRTMHYLFRNMRAIAIGAWLPEWEPNRIRGNRLWQKELSQFDAFILVTGSAHTGLPLASKATPFAAWVSSTVVTDRGERLRTSRNVSAFVERLGMLPVLKSEARVLTSANRIFVVSNDARDHIRKLTRNTVEVWPFPVDTDRFLPGTTTPDYPRFLFVGRANDPRKRVELFLTALEELHSSAPDLFVVGTIVSNAGSMIRALPHVEYRSGLSDMELIELYRASTALVLTSEQEGLGIAAMEAMACGLPVISTRCGGPETFIEDEISGMFVSDDPRKIAEAMFRLATNSDVRERMGHAARERIEHDFSEHAWNNKFESLILNLCNAV